MGMGQQPTASNTFMMFFPGAQQVDAGKLSVIHGHI